MRSILSLVLLVASAIASSSSSPSNACSLFTSLPPGITCTSSALTNGKLAGRWGVGPWALGGTHPFNFDISALSLDTNAEFDFCANPASMQFDATLTIPLPDGGNIPQELDQMITAEVSTITDGSLSWSSPTLSISKKVEMGHSTEIALPFFYSGGFKAIAKLDLGLTGSISAFTIDLKVGMCVAFAGDVAGLMPDGKTELCLTDMPDCTGCSGDAACPWSAKAFPCNGDTSCTLVSDTDKYCTPDAFYSCQMDSSCRPTCAGIGTCPNDCHGVCTACVLNGDGADRYAADLACAALGQPNLPHLLGDPPYTILDKTYDFTSLCPSSGPTPGPNPGPNPGPTPSTTPPPPPAAPPPLTTTSVTVTTGADPSDLEPHIAALKTSLASSANVAESAVEVTVTAGSAVITLSVTTATSQAAAMHTTISGLFPDAAHATTWLAQATGLDATTVAVTSVSAPSQNNVPGGDDGLSGGAIAGIVLGTLAFVAILAGVVMMAIKKDGGSPIIKDVKGATQMADEKKGDDRL